MKREPDIRNSNFRFSLEILQEKIPKHNQIYYENKSIDAQMVGTLSYFKQIRSQNEKWDKCVLFNVSKSVLPASSFFYSCICTLICIHCIFQYHIY